MFLSTCFKLSLLLSVVFSKYYVITSSNPPFSECTTNDLSSDFKGYEIEYAKNLMSAVKSDDFEIDWAFQCLNFSNISEISSNNENILFYIGGINQYNSLELISQGMKLSYPISMSGLSILLYYELKTWVFFNNLSWIVIFFIIIIPIIIGFLQFIFEESSYVLEVYVWNAYSALFLMSNLKLTKTSSRVMIFALWFMGFIIWTMSFAGIFSCFCLQNPLFLIKSIFDLNDKYVKSSKYYLDDIIIYGAKFSPIYNQWNEFSIDFYQNMFINPNDGIYIDALVIEDPIARYIENSDKRFLRIDAQFIPIYYYLIFPETVDIGLMNIINRNILLLNEKSSISYTSSYDSYYKIPMQLMEELLILLGVSLSFSCIIQLISRFILPRMKISQYMIERKLLSPLKSRKKDLNFAKKKYVFSTFGLFKGIIENEANKIIADIKIRLEIMSDKVTKFYDSLLIPSKDFQIENSLSPLKFGRKSKKTLTFPNLLKAIKKESIISNKSRKKAN